MGHWADGIHVNNDFARWSAISALRLRQVRMEVTLILIRGIKSYKREMTLESGRISRGKTDRTIFLPEE